MINIYELSLSIIFEKYQDLTEVFSKEKAHEFSLHRGHLNHHINFKFNSKSIYDSIYNLFETKLNVLKEYLKEKLVIDFIRSFISSYDASVLFVKKFNDSLRLCIDY